MSMIITKPAKSPTALKFPPNKQPGLYGSTNRAVHRMDGLRIQHYAISHRSLNDAGGGYSFLAFYDNLPVNLRDHLVRAGKKLWI